MEWAEAEGLGLAPFGLDLQHLHFQAHFADGCWDHAQELADGFPVRVTRQSEALLSAMALFVDVARGNPAVGERRTWLEPFWDDVFVAYIARGILAEHALWQGDCERALAEAEAAIDADAWPAHSPSVIRVTATALAARADRAAQLRAAGDAAGADAEAAAGAALLACRPGGRQLPRPGPRRCSGRRAAAGLPAAKPNTPASPGRTPPMAGRGCWPSSGPATCTRRRAPSGGWPRRWWKPGAATTRNPGKVKNHRNKIKGKVKGQKHRGTHRAYDRERCRHKHTRHPPGAGSGGNSLAPRYRLNRAVVTVFCLTCGGSCPATPGPGKDAVLFPGADVGAPAGNGEDEALGAENLDGAQDGVAANVVFLLELLDRGQWTGAPFTRRDPVTEDGRELPVSRLGQVMIHFHKIKVGQYRSGLISRYT